MSLLKRKKTGSKKGTNKDVRPKKQAMTFAEFQSSFQSLDSNNFGSWPAVVKITIIIGIISVIALLTYFIPVKKKLDEIKAAESEKQSLLQTYKEKESKARHLDEYKNQIAQMEVEFNSLLDQLPKETRVPELVRGINMTGVGSNIRFKRITVEQEVEQEFFIEQPIKIEASGDYHQFGSFVSGLAALPRIITMHNFEVKNLQKGSNSGMNLENVTTLNLILDTKTYRSKTINEQAEETESQEGDAQ